jgi:AmmeMemoRadiSam system protein B
MERSPAVAGRFYPGDSQELAALVRELIGPNSSHDKALAIIAPHAGYVYSGAIAADVYRQVRVPSIAVVLCPNHTGEGTPTAIVSSGSWRIPGANVAIAQKFAENFKQLARLDEDSDAHENEHSAEVHVPFLVQKNPRVTLVPVCFGHLPFQRCAEIGRALAAAIRDEPDDVLIVASTDMSHYLPASVAETQDRKALDRIQALDAEGLYTTVVYNNISMCGFIPVAVALVAAKELGATKVKLARYGNSGQTSGDYDRVVGYAGLVIR